MSKYFSLKITLLSFLLTFVLTQTTKPAETKSSDNKSLRKFLEATSTIFLSGLFDRSFFITTFMAIKYSKWVVMISASLALTSLGIISVFLGVTINNYIPTLWMGILSISLFFIFGAKMVIEGLKIPKNTDLLKLEEAHIRLNLEESESLVIRSDGENNSTKSNSDASSSHDHVTDLQVFIKVFILIFASEIGDRSQISTIYLTKDFDKIIVLFSVVLAQNLNTVLAIFGGRLIAKHVSERNLTIIAGVTFIVMGVVALYLLCVYDLADINNTDTIVIPNKTALNNLNTVIPPHML